MLKQVNTEQNHLNLLIKQFMLQKQADGLADSTLESYRYALKHFYQYLCKNNFCKNNTVTDIRETIRETDIRDYFIYLRGCRYSAATLRDKYAVLHAFFGYLLKHGYIQENPVKIRKPAVHGRALCFTNEEIECILNHYKNIDTFTKLRDYTIISVLLATGIRRAELLGITSVNRDYIRVTGKGSKTRYVPVSRGLRRVLDKYIAERNKRAVCPYLIVTKAGTRLTNNGLRAVFTRLSNATGISGKRFSAHTFRHTYATLFLKNGGDLASLQHILGHADIATTAIYLHWNDDAAKRVNDRVNPFDNFYMLF